MKHKGKAFQAAVKLIFIGGILCGVIGIALSLLGVSVAAAAGSALVPALLFIAFTLYFFRDPDPNVPAGNELVVAPGHGKVDLIDESEEPHIIGGRCRRISIFLSVFDVHVQQAPIAGTVSFMKHTPGAYLNAMSADCAKHNENVLIGFKAASPSKNVVGIRLITGLIARRIVPWVTQGDVVGKGERISHIQFGSRVNVYLPLDSEVIVKLGDRVVGGQTVLARLAAN